MEKIIVSVFLSIIPVLSVSPVYAQETISTTLAADEKADAYQWVVKRENGKVYKRLWNASKKRWETGWIQVVT